MESLKNSTLKVAWFSNSNTESLSNNFTNKLAKHLNLNISIFNQKTYQYFNAKMFDFCIFLIEDELDSNFSFELSSYYPGIKILFSNTLNNLLFNSLSHHTNGIVYKELLEKYFKNLDINVGNYHMLGWSLDIYKKIFPIYYTNLTKGNVIGINNFTSYDLSINYPISLNSEYPELNETGNEISVCLEKIDLKTIRALENLRPVIFQEKDFLNQINVKRGLNSSQIIEKTIEALDKESDKVKVLKDEILKESKNHLEKDIAKHLELILESKIEGLLNAHQKKLLELKENSKKVINSSIDKNLSNDLFHFIH